MLYIQDQDGSYLPAPKETIFTEARRISGYQLRRGALIRSSNIAREVIAHKLDDRQCEVFACLFLDTKYRVLEFKAMFRGSVNCATVHPREVVKEALRLNAAAIILAHTHPSGDATPSRNDIDLTHKLKDILQVIDVKVLDHLVIGDQVTSMADAGYLA